LLLWQIAAPWWLPSIIAAAGGRRAAPKTAAGTKNAKKGVGAWYLTAQAAVLRDVNVSWVYDWYSTPQAQVSEGHRIRWPHA
jgi:hypothetical protein